MKHVHRLTPGHMGGEYVKENTIEVDNSECDGDTQIHPMWHFTLWQLYGKKEDYLAWKGLAGMIGKEEIIKEIQRETCRKVGRSNKGRTKFDSNIGVFGTEKKLAWWDARPEQKIKRSRRAGLAGKGVSGNRRNGALAQPVEAKSRGGKKGSQTTNSTRWEDPDHPELGAHHFNVLKKLQRENGYPDAKENRRRVQ